MPNTLSLRDPIEIPGPERLPQRLRLEFDGVGQRVSMTAAIAIRNSSS